MTSSKHLSMTIGVIAAGAIAVFPVAAFAQNAPQSPPAAEQARPKPPRIRLSDDQQAKFQEIQTTAIGQIEKVLSAEQQKQFATGRQDGRGLGAIDNLSDPQKVEIRKILESANTEIGNILTQEQKEEINRSLSKPQ